MFGYHNQRVVGSKPTVATYAADVAQTVERLNHTERRNLCPLDLLKYPHKRVMVHALSALARGRYSAVVSSGTDPSAKGPR